MTRCLQFCQAFTTPIFKKIRPSGCSKAEWKASTMNMTNCGILGYDDSQGEFKEHQIEIETKTCVGSTCTWKIDAIENAIILEGTSIICNGSPNFGIVTKSKYLTPREQNFERIPPRINGDSNAISMLPILNQRIVHLLDSTFLLLKNRILEVRN